MNVQSETTPTFRTKSGYAEVTADRIIIKRSGWRGMLSQFILGDSMVRILILYGLLVIFCAYLAYDYYQDENTFFAFYFGFFAAYLAYGTIKSFNNSATPIIERDKIKSIRLIRGTQGLTRNRFEIMFENDKGKVKKRTVIMPGILEDGKNETLKALGIFVEEGLMRDN